MGSPFTSGQTEQYPLFTSFTDGVVGVLLRSIRLRLGRQCVTGNLLP